MQLNKTDQNVAEGLDHIMRTGWFRAVQGKSFDSDKARSLLGARIQLVGMTTRLSNHIRGVLKTFGLLPGSMRGMRFDQRVDAMLADGVRAIEPRRTWTRLSAFRPGDFGNTTDPGTQPERGSRLTPRSTSQVRLF